MQGILIGVLGTLAVLLALRLALFASRRRRWCRSGRGRGWLLGRLFRRLDATPEQQKVLLEGLESVREEMHALRRGLFASREELAATLASERFDSETLDAIWSKQVARAGNAKEVLAAALARFHAALDARQRALLAEMVRTGGSHRACA